MLYHIVWLKAQEGTTAAHLEEVLEDVRGLKGKVPGIAAIHAGKNVTDRAKGYSHGIVVILERPEDLQGYIDHPAHRAVGARLLDCCDLMAMDFEDAP